MGGPSLMWMRVGVYVLSNGCGGGDVDVSNSGDVLCCSSALTCMGWETNDCQV
jgi:hypothetical protein